MITSIEFVNTLLAGALAIGCTYCIWNGRKVMKIWIESKTTPWEMDEENPANWYLKDPNKFRVMNK